MYPQQEPLPQSDGQNLSQIAQRRNDYGKLAEKIQFHPLHIIDYLEDQKLGLFSVIYWKTSSTELSWGIIPGLH